MDYETRAELGLCQRSIYYPEFSGFSDSALDSDATVGYGCASLICQMGGGEPEQGVDTLAFLLKVFFFLSVSLLFVRRSS